MALYKLLFFLLLLTATSCFAQKQIAITIDDPTIKATGGKSWQEKNEALLLTLERHKVKAALFVCGMRVDNAEGRKLLVAWDKANHLICNHSYSHWYFNSESLPVAQFIADFRKGDSVIQGYRHYTKLFRFPYLKEGNTVEKRDSMRQALQKADYRNGYVSIDASDWYIDAEMIKAIEAGMGSDLRPYRDYYVYHILNRAAYYDSLAQQVWQKPVKHNLLIHHSLLNALFLDDILLALKQNGWTIINAGDAFTDPVYQQQTGNVPAGESILWQLARQDKRWAEGLRYPAEDGAYEKAPLAEWLRKHRSE